MTGEESRSNLMSKKFGKDDLADKAELEQKLWELQGYVFRYLRTFGLEDGVVEDALQEAMMNAWMHIDQLRDVSLIKGWVRSIAKNVGLKYVKKVKQRQRQEISLETAMENIVSEEDETKLCQELCIYMDTIDTEYIEKLLCCLSQREKNVILLQYAFQHSLKEVAQIIGETYVNTRTISSRAKEKVRENAAKEERRG